ncbi:hypothetical protein F7725_025871 [Dissostichus mawsoni]|uniref:Endonuclease/exonuclease/phosphatase domain-containing protein n=1 Tax=Dissostichus mawsoni TaxID=36200 RepID=A0A7J5X5H0_DISMA|nr:hypothetical protein F7725_025871 [Dissostichus mawsoni]
MQRKNAPVFKSFSGFCDLHGFSQLITQPTRYTTIDLILTSDESRISGKGVIACGLSDHYMIFCTRKKLKQRAGCHKTVTSRDLKTYSSEAFNLELESLDWSEELSGTQVEETWLGFKTKFSTVLNNMAPLRTTRVKNRAEPWMHSDILTAMKTRDKKCSEFHKSQSMLTKSTSSELQAHVTELKLKRNRLRNDVNSMIKTAKKNFINDKTEVNKNKPRELWKLLNNQLGCSKKLKTRFSNIKTDNTLITDKLDVANYLNIFFTNSHNTCK